MTESSDQVRRALVRSVPLLLGSAIAAILCRPDQAGAAPAKKQPAQGARVDVSHFASVHAALAALPASGGTLYFPKGHYRIDRPLTFCDRSDVVLVGDGANASMLDVIADADALVFTGTCCRIRIDGLWIGSFARRDAGTAIAITGTPSAPSNEFVVENVTIQNLFQAVEAHHLHQSHFRHVVVAKNIDGRTGPVFRFVDSVSIRVTDCAASAFKGTFTEEALLIDQNCDTIVVQGCEFGRAAFGVRLAGSRKTPPRLIRLLNVYAERCSSAGFQINAARDVRLQGCHAAVNAIGFKLVDGDSIHLSDCLALQNEHEGVRVDGGESVTLIGCAVSNNSARSAPGAGCGIRVDGGTQGTPVSGFCLVGNRVGDFIYSAPKTQSYGLVIGPRVENLAVIGNDLRGNTVAPMFNRASGRGNVVLDGETHSLEFGGDANLYRAGPNMLKTDDRLIAVDGIGVGNKQPVTSVGKVVARVPIYDAQGGLLGYLPVYDQL